MQLNVLADEMMPKHYKARQYILVADSLLKKRDLPTALQFYRKALEQVSSSYTIMRIGQIFLMKQNTEQALPFLEKAYFLNPAEYRISYNLAVAYYAIGRYKESDAILNKLLYHHPGFKDPSKLRQRLNASLSR